MNKEVFVTQNMHLLLRLDEFVYLSARLRIKSPTLPSNIASSIPAHEEIAMQQKNLLEVLKLIVLKSVCWHTQL